MGSKTRFYVDFNAVHPEVTGSCIYVKLHLPNGNVTRFCVDFGLFQEKAYEELNSKVPLDVANLDFILVTHTHVDHVGKLPFAMKHGFKGKIYLTEPASILLRPALEDSCKVLRDLAQRKNVPCLYRDKHVDETLSSLEPCAFERTITIDNNIKVTFFKNGHLLGASLILVQLHYPNYEPIDLMFTGDYNNKNVFFDVNPLPKWVTELPITVVQESTYGNMDTSDIEETFKENILNCLKNDGTVVATAFSFGKSQEILYNLRKFQLSNDLSTDISIGYDGKLGLRYTTLYLQNKLGIKNSMLDFLPENLTFVSEKDRQNLLNNNKKKIIVTTSGMGSHGPAQLYIPSYITRKNALIHFTGYTSKGTLGDKLKQTKIGEITTIGGVLLKKLADVQYTTEFSSHAKADVLIDFLQQFTSLKVVFINHGEHATKNIYSKRVINEVAPKNVAILDPDSTFRVDGYGLVKSIPTKFQ